jgi:hypothetical protein
MASLLWLIGLLADAVRGVRGRLAGDDGSDPEDSDYQ